MNNTSDDLSVYGRAWLELPAGRNEHFIERCRDCQAVIARCRCMGQKIERIGICDACERLSKSDSLPAPQG